MALLNEMEKRKERLYRFLSFLKIYEKIKKIQDGYLFMKELDYWRFPEK